MQTATLKNTTKRPKTVILDHPAFRDKKYGFSRTGVPTTVTNDKGQSSVVTKNKSIPGSITVPAGGEVEGLHPAIKNCTQVATGLSKGEFTLELVNEKAAPKPARQRKPRAAAAAPAASEGDNS
jgi:hypothetical protein